MPMSIDPPPRVSVVLPTHNRLALFQRALASVLAQTVSDIEVLVIDNACTDGTSEYLAQIGDARVRTVRLDTFSGVSEARNAAIALARAELLAFQDDDDIWLPDKLDKQIACLDASADDVGLCLAGYIRLVPQGLRNCFRDQDFAEVDFSRVRGLVSMGAIATPAWLVRTQLVREVGGFDVLMPARNDWELALRLSDVCRFVYLPEPLFIQDQRHVTSMAGNEQRVVAGVRRILDKHGARWAAQPSSLAYFHYVIGRYELTCGDKQRGYDALRKALQIRPGLLAARLLLLASRVGGESTVRQLRQWRQALRRLRWSTKTHRG